MHFKSLHFHFIINFILIFFALLRQKNWKNSNRQTDGHTREQTDWIAEERTNTTADKPSIKRVCDDVMCYCVCVDDAQWRCQDLLRGGAKLECWTLCHEALTVDFRAGCSSCSMTNSFVTNAVLIERAVSCWHLHQLISQTTQYLDSWLSEDLLQSELKWNCWKSRGARAPVPHSWWRHWRRRQYVVTNIDIYARFSGKKRDRSETLTQRAKWSQFALFQ